MVTDSPTELLTIREAARFLKVSPLTVRRWLKQGRLPAYRLGPRAIRIRRADLDASFSPIAEEEVRTVKEAVPVPAKAIVKPLTEDQVARGLQALEQSRALSDAILARRRGEPLAASWPLIRSARDERSGQP